jgi:hypothetical protein
MLFTSHFRCGPCHPQQAFSVLRSHFAHRQYTDFIISLVVSIRNDLNHRVLYDDYDNRHAYLGYRFNKASFSRCWKRFWPFHLFLVFPDLVWYWTVSSRRRSSIFATFVHLLCYWMVSYTCWVFSHKVQSFFFFDKNFRFCSSQREQQFTVT